MARVFFSVSGYLNLNGQLTCNSGQESSTQQARGTQKVGEKKKPAMNQQQRQQQRVLICVLGNRAEVNGEFHRPIAFLRSVVQI